MREMTVVLTSNGFTAKWQDETGQWWLQEVDLRSEDLHPFMWETNAAEGLT